MADIRTETVEFPTNGETGTGYIASPEGDGPFPGVVVVQEWWGLDDHIKDVAERFAREGFVALAPDLYHGKVTKEPDEAQKLMMSLDMPRATKELVKATESLALRPEVAGRGIGTIGFCMGGGLSLTLATESEHIKAAAPFYGANPSPIENLRNLRGPVFSVFAEHDSWINESVRKQREDALRETGVKHEVQVYPGTEHAFFNDTRAEVYNRQASEDAWRRVLALFRENL